MRTSVLRGDEARLDVRTLAQALRRAQGRDPAPHRARAQRQAPGRTARRRPVAGRRYPGLNNVAATAASAGAGRSHRLLLGEGRAPLAVQRIKPNVPMCGGRTAEWFGPRGEAEPDSDAGRRASVLRWLRRAAHGRLACRLPRRPPSGHGPRNPHRAGARGRQPAAQCMQWGAMGGSRKRSSKRPRQRCVKGRCWQKRYAVEVLPGRGARRADPPAKLTDRASAP